MFSHAFLSKFVEFWCLYFVISLALFVCVRRGKGTWSRDFHSLA